jgi:hypothetical protein
MRSERAGILMKATSLVIRDLLSLEPRVFGDDLAKGTRWPLNPPLRFSAKDKAELPPAKAEEFS